MNKGEKQIFGVAAIAILIVVFLAAMQMGYLAQYGIPPISGTGLQQNGNGNNNNNGGNTATDYSQGIGKYSLSFQAMNTSNSAALAFGTQLDAWVLHYVNGQYLPEGGAYSGTTQYFTATAADDGYMWIEVKPHTTTYYVDYSRILNTQGGYVIGAQYVSDPLGDGHRDYIFQFDLKNQPVPAAGMYPVLSFTAWGLCYDSGFSQGISGLGNQSNIGAVSVPKFYENDISFSSSGQGVGFYKVEIIFGNGSVSVTDQTKVSLVSMSFPGLGTISGQSFNVQYEATDIRYSYTMATSLYGADYVYLPLNTNNKFPVNTQLQWTLASTDEIPVTINVYYFNVAGVGQKTTTTFYANAGSGTP